MASVKSKMPKVHRHPKEPPGKGFSGKIPRSPFKSNIEGQMVTRGSVGGKDCRSQSQF